MSNLHIFGDSFSTPNFCVSPEHSWWGLSAVALGSSQTLNYSWCGNNLDAIVYNVMHNHSQFCKNDKVIVGVPPLARINVFSDKSRTKVYYRYDREFECTECQQVLLFDGIDQTTIHDCGTETINLYNFSLDEAQSLRNIVLLSSWFEQNSIEYLFVNLHVPFQSQTNWPLLNSMQKLAYQNNRCILFDKTYHSVNLNVHRPVDFDTYGWHGHHGEPGNKHWFETVLLPKYKELRWL